MFFPVLGSHIGVVEIRCFDLKRGYSCSKMAYLVPNLCVSNVQEQCFQELKSLLRGGRYMAF